jgi:endogenous inhibitor of DNA gyrase (YacG/DUF329 family)
MTTNVKCPTCEKDVRWVPESRFRPFCSDRCKQIDLGAWATEKYKIGGSAQDTPPDEDSYSGLN